MYQGAIDGPSDQNSKILYSIDFAQPDGARMDLIYVVGWNAYDALHRVIESPIHLPTGECTINITPLATEGGYFINI